MNDVARCRTPTGCAWLLAGLLSMASPAGAHSASDAYLNLSTATGAGAAGVALHGQWDIALRDLDFVLGLDDDGDGHVTWGEVKRHRLAIEQYAFGRLGFGGGANNACSIKPAKQLIDDHADGTYAALFFDVICAHAPKTLTMDYGLFFPVDPSHRGIFVMRAGNDISTAVLSPEHSKISLKL